MVLRKEFEPWCGSMFQRSMVAQKRIVQFEGFEDAQIACSTSHLHTWLILHSIKDDDSTATLNNRQHDSLGLENRVCG